MSKSQIIKVKAQKSHQLRAGEWVRDSAALLALSGFLGVASMWASIMGGIAG